MVGEPSPHKYSELEELIGKVVVPADFMLISQIFNVEYTPEGRSSPVRGRTIVAYVSLESEKGRCGVQQKYLESLKQGFYFDIVTADLEFVKNKTFYGFLPCQNKSLNGKAIEYAKAAELPTTVFPFEFPSFTAYAKALPDLITDLRKVGCDMRRLPVFDNAIKRHMQFVLTAMNKYAAANTPEVHKQCEQELDNRIRDVRIFLPTTAEMCNQLTNAAYNGDDEAVRQFFREI